MAAAGPQHIDAKDLLPGDIIFFMDFSGQANHVAIYNVYKDDTHFISHAVSEPYHSMMVTRLKDEDLPYQVFRCQDFSLASQVAKRMFFWANNGVPFSHTKHNDIYANFTDARGHCHPKTGGEAQCETAAGKFADNFYRYISMASHPGFPYKINDDLSYSEGVYCSEAVTMAFNVEELLKAGAVRSAESLGVNWVSDKTTSKEEITRFNPSERYMQYYKAANDKYQYEYGKIDSNVVSDGAHPCSLAVWRYDRYGSIEKFVDEYKFNLPLDSTLASPWAMMTWMTKNPNLWQNLGKMVVPKIHYPLEKLELMKADWHQYVCDTFAKREENKTRLSRLSNVAAYPADASMTFAFSNLSLRRSKSAGKLDPYESKCDTEKSATVMMASKVIRRRASLFGTPQKPGSKPIDSASPRDENSREAGTARRKLRF